MRTMTRPAFYINNEGPVAGELEQRQDVETVHTSLPIPDPRWELVDGNGHYHARDDAEDSYPTLKTRVEHVDCDGSCGGVCEGEGYTVTHYHCVICDEEVEPGVIPGPHSINMPGIKSWQVTVHSAIPLDRKVTVRVQFDDVTLFGVALATEMSRYPFDGYKATLIGISPLGRRPMGPAA